MRADGVNSGSRGTKWHESARSGSWTFSFRLPLAHREKTRVLSRNGDQGANDDTQLPFCPPPSPVLWDKPSRGKVFSLALLGPGLDYSSHGDYLCQFCWRVCLHPEVQPYKVHGSSK